MKRCKNKSNIEILRSYISGERPFVQIGYTPQKSPSRKDGDTWTDKDGIEKIKIGSTIISKKLYDAIEQTKPICSSCGIDLRFSNNRYDKKIYLKTGKCYDCIIKEETQMRIEGTFDTYEKLKIIKNQKSFLLDMKEKITQSLEWARNDGKISFVNGDGSVEEWSGFSKEKFIETLNRDLIETDQFLSKCDESICKLENEYIKLKEK